jgi:hypothetical protein
MPKRPKQMLSKMNSNALLKKVVAGNMNVKEAREVATIIERRFPTPKKLLNQKGRRKAKVIGMSKLSLTGT